MAGIGFELRKLTRRDDLLGIVQGYAHSALASTGPWLFTIMSLASIVLLLSRLVPRAEMANFRLIIIYNFSFSLVFTGPTVMVATRYLADMIHQREIQPAPSMLIGNLSLLFLAQSWIVGIFYFGYVELDMATRLAATANFFLITGIWLVSVFVTALKDYNSITWSFATGMGLALVATVALAPEYSLSGMLLGFNLGLATIFFSLIARVFAEYPYPVLHPFRFLGPYRKYWEIALSGFLYNAAIWADKWIMWLSPQREALKSGMVSYPNYDSAMFLSYLTIVPSMAVFVFSVETEFFEKYLRFYRDIQHHANFARIAANHQQIIRSVLSSGRNFLVLQGSVCLLTILLAPRLFELFDITFVQLGMFRFGVLGAFFHVLFLVLSILLSYFDLRRATMWLQLLFLVTNTSFSYLILGLGFAFYGYGYFLASLVTFLVAFLVSFRYLLQLPFHTFLRSNTSVR